MNVLLDWKKEIKDLEDTIYEKDLEIESLQNQKDLSLLLLYRRLNKKLMFRGLGILIMSAAENIEFLLNSIKNEKNQVFAVSQGDFVYWKSRRKVFG